jgi:hypothetical protein
MFIGVAFAAQAGISQFGNFSKSITCRPRGRIRCLETITRTVSAKPLYRPRRPAKPSLWLTSIGHNVVSATLSYWPRRRLGRAVIGGRRPFLSLGLLNNQPQLLAKHPNYSPYSFDADDDTLLVAVVDADSTLAAQHPNYYSPSQRDTDEQTTINPSNYSPNHCWFPA